MRIWIAACLLLCAMWAARRGVAQTAGTIEGTVLDQSGRHIPGCAVKLTEAGTNASRAVQTDDRGRFRAANLPPGLYRVEATREGFRSAVREDAALSAGRTLEIDFRMQLGDLRETLVVTDESPLLTTSASDWGGTVGAAQLGGLPLNGRDLFDLVAQQPGVVVANHSEGAIFNGLGIQPSANGARPNQNSFRIDGIYMNDAAASAPASAVGRLLGVEGIQELRLITNPFSAEYGRAAGAVFTAVSKSGANDWHGSLYHYLRNSALDARNFFDSPSEATPPLRRNQFGAMASGPIRSDHAFFMVNYEGIREARSRTQRAVTLSAMGREGMLPGGPVAVSPLVKPYLALYPLPNGKDYGDGAGEFVSSAASRNSEHYGVARGDFLVSRRLRTSVRFSGDSGTGESPDPFLVWAMQSDSRFAFLQSETHFVQSPETLHAFRFGWAHVRNTESAAAPSLPASL
ncbi:MAG TPA: carboxypeptidase regulatory-like domain-containing protein, partial [Bryobacteraceae bacterium]|nr:carboxypeptidase regulatory-like domain-containing protein [Bryobacteraceae bacterium]